MWYLSCDGVLYYWSGTKWRRHRVETAPIAIDAHEEDPAAHTGCGTGRVLTTGASSSCRLQTASAQPRRQGEPRSGSGDSLISGLLYVTLSLQANINGACMHVPHVADNTMTFVAAVICFAIGCVRFATLNIEASHFAMGVSRIGRQPGVEKYAVGRWPGVETHAARRGSTMPQLGSG